MAKSKFRKKNANYKTKQKNNHAPAPQAGFFFNLDPPQLFFKEAHLGPSQPQIRNKKIGEGGGRLGWLANSTTLRI
jgi:hypothetical protein